MGRRREWTARATILLVAVIVAPVTLLALVPTVFGLDRYVMSKDVMGGSVGRGALMFDQMVPASDLVEGDIVTFRPPESSGIDRNITRRVVLIEDGYIRTQADTFPTSDPWWLDQRDYPALSRLVISVPYVGYPFLLADGRSTWNLLLVGAGGLLGGVVAHDAWRSRRRPIGSSATAHV